MASEEQKKKIFEGRNAKTTETIQKLAQLMPEEKRLSPEEIKKFTEEMIKRQSMFSMIDIHRHGDYTMLPPFFPDTLQEGYDNWEPGKGVVLLATFAKTGTTWVTEILRQLLYGRNETTDELSKMIMSVRGYIEMGPTSKHDFFSRIPMERKLIPTHLPSELVNVDRLMKNNAKFIYVTRNPKDTTASLYKFLHSLPFNEKVTSLFPKDFDEFTDAFMQGKIPLAMKTGDWYPQHIKSWLKYKNEKSFLFIQFEEIKADPVKAIRKIADFIECGASDDDVKKVAESTAFDAMKAAREKEDSGIAKVIMNKGQVGNWKSSFSDELSRKMDEKMAKDMEGVDFDFTYEL